MLNWTLQTTLLQKFGKIILNSKVIVRSIIDPDDNCWRNASGLTLCCWWLIWPIQNDAKNLENQLKPWHMGTHLRALSMSYLMNTNITGSRPLQFNYLSYKLRRQEMSHFGIKKKVEKCVFFVVF